LKRRGWMGWAELPLMKRFSSDSVFWLIISSSFWRETFSS